ncbi:hypothetical protein LZ198_41175 [Myxococcus sp. K15C18031901]|uniref:hypothetical protein n=1 Tax=Myxococcus dinghuensis TaxID=2906761 RepID=UPI0020A7978F|nr:hypothetical protein [Myxococcus dinghuensis]MCP3105300.1 hypothetical protein [Myxococcus dinghuensis]
MTGSCLVVGGLRVGSGRGVAMTLLGLGPLVSAVLDVVPLAPLFGLPLRGPDLRRALGTTEDGSLLDGHRRAASITLH